MNEKDEKPLTEIALRITNSLKQTITVHLEPWGEQYAMPAGTSFKVEAKGPACDTLELEYEQGKLVVYGWSGSVVTISSVEKAKEGSDQSRSKD